jgi:RNA polymerase sigma-54 factor
VEGGRNWVHVSVVDDATGQPGPLHAHFYAHDALHKKKNPFDEIDFGSYFQDYLDPGFRSPSNFEISDKPSFENFLSQPSTLTDHLAWQLGSLNLPPGVRDAAEYIVGNLDEDGYLTASDDELLAGYLREEGLAGASGQDDDVIEKTEKLRQLLAAALKIVQHLDPVGIATRDLRECLLVQIEAQRREFQLIIERKGRARQNGLVNGSHVPAEEHPAAAEEASDGATPAHPVELSNGVSASHSFHPQFDERAMQFETAFRIVDKHLSLLQKRDLREVAKAVGRPHEHVQRAFDYIRTLDPRPGQRYNNSEARLIEPDVVFVKRDNEFVVVMNEEDLPTLRLNQGYRRMLSQEGTEKDVKEYVKERYRSALQLMRNIEQRKNTILRTCECIVRRQGEFLEQGVDALKPMMIKEVAEEIGVHPSTVSRAVSNKYVHTPQGVFELRFFFSEGVNGPEGSSTPLMLLKRKVKKLIEDEDARKPLTDDQIAAMLQRQGIDVTRRTVAKYREDLHIPSTHQRRVRE